MHAKDDARIIRFRDGFWFSRALLRRETAELESLRVKLRPEAHDDLLHTVATIWQIVDSVHRVRELAQATPGMNQHDTVVRAFLAATVDAETFRHYVQHLRGELGKRDVDTFPVWGSVSWVSATDENTMFTAVIGAVPPGTKISTGPRSISTVRWSGRRRTP